MNKLRKKLSVAALSLVALASAFIFGCEGFSSGSDSFTWDDSYSFINFDGVYRGVGGPIVFRFSESSTLTSSGGGDGDDGDSTDDESVITITDELIGTGDGLETSFAANLSCIAVVPGSVTVTAGGITLIDDGDGLLAGSGAAGTIVYGTGSITVDYAVPPVATTPVLVDYECDIDEGDVEEEDEPGSTGGSASASIFTFTVRQQGNLLTITDSNGDVYEGRFDGMDFSANQIGEVPTGPVIGSFTVMGVSRGVEVTITGFFQGQLDGSTFEDRTIDGTWIQANGLTADVFGGAAAIQVEISDITIDADAPNS